jgi:hypothetical protein
MNAKFLVSMCVIGVMAFNVVSVQSQAPPADSASAGRTAEQATNPQAPGGGDGLVWVDTEVRVYYSQRSPFYGRTRKGKYMTEQKAIEAGYKRAPNARFL